MRIPARGLLLKTATTVPRRDGGSVCRCVTLCLQLGGDRQMGHDDWLKSH
jgi:hypothetical protein